MAFPTSPTNGQIYNKYIYNSVKSIWAPNTVFEPLITIASSGANVSYTLPFNVGEYKIYIPATYLKTAGTAGTLTITTGLGGSTPLVIPLSASGDTINSGDLLVPIYISSNGSVVAVDWCISGFNTSGSYIKYGDGRLIQTVRKTITFSTATGFASPGFSSFGNAFGNTPFAFTPAFGAVIVTISAFGANALCSAHLSALTDAGAYTMTAFSNFDPGSYTTQCGAQFQSRWKA